jgi:hypothetical protein
MKPEELRIGNYTEYNIIDENKDEWIFNEVEISDLGDVSCLRPIKITKEELELLGFLTESYIATGYFMMRGSKIVNINSNRGNYDYNIIVSADDYDNWRLIIETNPSLPKHKKEIDITLKPLTYIHELQNSYFNLTGYELKRVEKN